MLLNFLKRKIARDSKARWDHQYEKGKWECLYDPLEEPRFNAVQTALDRYGNSGSILEIGCGEGILQSRLESGSYSRYVGIDLSEVAIRKAMRLSNGHTSYESADMEQFSTEEKFDVVVFNESLYYAKKPLQLLQQYARFLTPGGYLILSIYLTTANQELLNSIAETWSFIEQQISSNERGSWCCQVYAGSTLSPKALS